MISICICFRNDFEQINSVIRHLLDTAQSDDLEILVYNDGSVYGSNEPRPLKLNYNNVRVINNNKSFGVGYSFDRCVEQASGDIIILMGSDVFPKEGWYAKVRNAVSRNPDTLGCAVCVGLNPKRMDMGDPKCFRRYGADLLFTVGNDDLPRGSALRARRGGYTDLFKAKWLMGKQSDESYAIPCVLGAFYFCTKEYYTKLGGWDTEPNNRYCGHARWGHLEAYISLKSWLVGGGCTLYPNIEAGHVFARVTIYNQWSKGGRSAEWMWWNALFMLETMIFDTKIRQKLYDFVHPEFNFNIAKQMIQRNYETVVRVREANRLKFRCDHGIFTEKFNYNFEI